MTMNGDHLVKDIPLPWQQRQWQRLLRQQQDDKLAHAYLFSGPSGTGKHLFAAHFARLLLCQSPADAQPCGHCRQCQSGGPLQHPDILPVQPEEGSRVVKIEQVRALSEFASHTSHSGIMKIILLDQAHRLNKAAANALLKTLEEPRGRTCLMLVTDLPGYLPATIRSRCQRLQFPAPKLDMAETWLQKQLTEEIDTTALLAVAECRPLLALELAASNAVHERHQFMQRLAALVAGKSSPQALLSQAMPLGELAVVEYLLAGSTILIKALLAKQTTAVSGHGLDALYELLARQPQQAALMRGLMGLYQDAMLARQQLLSGANPNGQLLLESLLWRWSQLLQGCDLRP